MVSAFGLFNALLLAYSRIPLVMAQDRFLPARLAATDARGTPRNAVLVSAVAYSAFAETRTALDRKSTRLNSSHLVISYAVFCLKKKKKKMILHLSYTRS